MRILLIEDDKSLNDAIYESLKDEGFDVDSVMSAQAGLDLLKTESFNMVISDIKMPGLSGYQFLEQHMKTDHPAPVLLMTAYGTIEQAVNALKLGACDYITKPFDIKTLTGKIRCHAVDSARHLGVIVHSKKSAAIFEMAKKVAQTDATVLIQGESGTGKEVLARYVHEQSSRKDNIFVGINCAAIPENMLEATLFGYEKGAFTGAYQTTPGKFEFANGGTLLLDEISEMPLNLQVKLLRVLQECEVERLGGKKQIPLNVRIIATTNRALAKEVSLGHFREDLYFRLNVFPIQCSPLRERQEDIMPLVNNAIANFGSSKKISKSVSEKLLTYAWPGNVRELQNVIQRAIILSPTETITEESLIFEGTSFQEQKEMPVKRELSENLSHQEFKIIQKTLSDTGGDKSKTADILGISPRTLRYKIAKMKKLGICL